MSKKSRKRNKKILGALAAGLGAMALMKRKKAASIAGMDDAAINVTHPALTAKNWITKKAEAVVPNTSSFKPRVYPGTMLNERGPKIINPNIDNPYVRKPPGTMRGMNYKKGGRVTGMAKRGFGRALMKGKN